MPTQALLEQDDLKRRTNRQQKLKKENKQYTSQKNKQTSKQDNNMHTNIQKHKIASKQRNTETQFLHKCTKRSTQANNKQIKIIASMQRRMNKESKQTQEETQKEVWKWLTNKLKVIRGVVSNERNLLCQILSDLNPHHQIAWQTGYSSLLFRSRRESDRSSVLPL